MNKKEYNIEEAALLFCDASYEGGKSELPSPKKIQCFREIILGYYREHRRDFPWRDRSDLYGILISEVMLQQTQTGRVAEKYLPFLEAFPTVRDLAEAESASVLRAWQGLGYNRRAVMLHRLARQVIDEYGGTIPSLPEELINLPGIGKATASSICAFACDSPEVFIETNIRTVYIHFFFPGTEEIHDREIMPLVEATLDRTSPRRWYSALMDYGVMLKKAGPNPSRRSRHHARQAPFEGSDRQVRGRILKLLLAEPGLTEKKLIARLEEPQERVTTILTGMTDEGLVVRKNNKYFV